MVDGQVGILGANARGLVDKGTSSATDTATIQLQNMEASTVLDQTRRHDRVPLNRVQVLSLFEFSFVYRIL